MTLSDARKRSEGEMTNKEQVMEGQLGDLLLAVTRRFRKKGIIHTREMLTVDKLAIKAIFKQAGYRLPETPPEQAVRKYPCDDCGILRSADEGGPTFTVCNECWDKHWKKPEQTNREKEVGDILQALMYWFKPLTSGLGKKKLSKEEVVKEIIALFPAPELKVLSPEDIQSLLKELRQNSGGKLLRTADIYRAISQATVDKNKGE